MPMPRRRRMTRTILLTLSICTLLWQTPAILERVDEAMRTARMGPPGASGATDGAARSGKGEDGMIVISGGRRLGAGEVRRLSPAIRSTAPRKAPAKAEGDAGRTGAEGDAAEDAAPAPDAVDSEAASRIMEMAKELLEQAEEQGNSGEG